jgi:hypothetical protein
MSEDPAIRRAIEEYQPPWLPNQADLRGTVVAIDPSGGGAKDATQRPWDDLALMTGAHLYHLVTHAGGVPVMTRADNRPAQAPGAEAAALRQACTQHTADVAVTIEFAAASGGGEVLPLADDKLSRVLAQCLGDALAVKVGGNERLKGRPSSGPGAPGAQLRLIGPEESAASLERKTYHRGSAERVYRGIASFVRAQRGALAGLRVQRFGGADPGSAGPVPYLPGQTWEEELAQTARRIWPEENLPIQKATWFCDMFRQVALSDRTTVYLKPRITVEGGTVVIGGATNVAVMRDAVADALRAVGVENVCNEMRLLPEEGRLGDQRFGVCTAPTALTFAEPSEAAGLQSQLLYGEPLLLLDHDAGHYLVHGGDGYWGWVREDGVRTMSAREFEQYTGAKRAVLLRDFDLSDRRAVQGSTLPIAATKGNDVTLLCPDGGAFDVAAEDVRLEDDPNTAGERAAKALNFLYRPYVFGGVSPLGLDCSGLVGNVCAQTGLAMARDASKQFLHGRLVATRWHRDGLRAGDLLYFINSSGRIFHVGIALSPTHFVHSAPPEVQINSLRPGDRLYSEYRARSFFAAKRVP